MYVQVMMKTLDETETPTLNYREAFITQSNPVQVFENTFEPIFC